MTIAKSYTKHCIKMSKTWHQNCQNMASKCQSTIVNSIQYLHDEYILRQSSVISDLT